MVIERRNIHRVLAIAPMSRGFGYAVMDGSERLADWGLKTLDGEEKNARTISQVKRLIEVYRPNVLVMEDFWQESSNRANRIRLLGEELLLLAKSHQVATKVLRREPVWTSLVGHTGATKFEVAQIVAATFAEDLEFCLPAKRKLWKGEDKRFAIFVATALAVEIQGRNGSRKAQ